MLVTLRPHPATPSSPVDRIEVEIERIGKGGLSLVYRAFGEIDRVLAPAPATPSRADGLWRHTCFEAFVASSEDPAYLELNFAPSLQWAAYRFEGERLGMRPAGIEPPTMRRFNAPPLALEARIASVEPERPASAWRIGLSAVIEDLEGDLSYWALAHPSDKPNFHHPDSFTLVLPAPEPT